MPKRILSRVECLLRKAAQRWALRRSPRVHQLTLSQKRIYIMPSTAGFMFVALLFVLLLLGINYQNNLAYGATFLLTSLFVVTILHTYANLSGITITFLKGHHCFAGEAVAFDLQLSASGQRQYENIQLCWEQGDPIAVDLLEKHDQRISLYMPAQHRGVLKAGALLIETFYPLGLFRAWTWLDADLSAVVFPKPIAGGGLSEAYNNGENGVEAVHSGVEEFDGLEQYQKGMSPRHIAWKQYARGLGLHAKSYVDYSAESCWLSWHMWPELNTEERLSRLAYWALQFEKQAIPYGLIIPGAEVKPALGEAHRNRVLEALALFPAAPSVGDL